jgi:putative addiction module killer protein
MKQIKYLKLDNGKEPVRQWLNTLDIKMQARIRARFERVSEGNLGDWKKLTNSELSELRFDFGKGYRVYFKELDDIILLLVNGGDKSSQKKDVNKAEEYYKIWKEYNNEEI